MLWNMALVKYKCRLLLLLWSWKTNINGNINTKIYFIPKCAFSLAIVCVKQQQQQNKLASIMETIKDRIFIFSKFSKKKHGLWKQMMVWPTVNYLFFYESSRQTCNIHRWIEPTCKRFNQIKETFFEIIIDGNGYKYIISI